MAQSIHNVGVGTQPRTPYNVREVARLTGFSCSLIYEHARTHPERWGRIKVGRAIRFRPEAIDALVRGATSDPTPQNAA